MKLIEYLKNKKVYVIAEMSGNHGGKIEKAIEIIHSAQEAGADCVKIQTYTADTLTIDCNNTEFKINRGLWKGENLYSLYKKAYTPWEWTKDLKDETEKLGMDFLSTPFDFTAVDYLERCCLEFYKIASMEIVDIPLIKRIAQTGKPTIISCGMSTIDEIKEAVDAFKKHSSAELILLKCCSAYPSKYDDMNISTIPDMINRFKTYVGLSDHSSGSIASITAISLGACVVEKHFCISKEDNTVDSAFSLDKNEFKQLVNDIRNAERALGVPKYGVSDDELSSYSLRRSLYVVKDIKSGEKFTAENIKSIRPAKGLHTRYYEKIITECHAKIDLKFGTPLSKEMIKESI